MITILGGGVAGAALALALARRGRPEVVVIDPGQLGEGSTGQALGGFRTQHGSELNVRLSLLSRPFFEARAARVRFQPTGYLYIAETPEAAQELERRAELQRGLGLPIEHPEPAALVPFLETEDLLGANFCRLDGLYLPLLVLESLVEEARAAGASFQYGCSASSADLEAEVVVVAAGAWSRTVGERLGVKLDVEPLERGVFEVGPLAWLPSGLPMVLEAGSGYHFREREGRLLVMGPGDQDEWGHFREWLGRRAPGADSPRPADHWVGNYETTFDQHPLVGETERAGTWAMCGFSGHGVMHSPAVADCLAAMILGETPALDISALSPLRTEPLLDRTQL